MTSVRTVIPSVPALSLFQDQRGPERNGDAVGCAQTLILNSPGARSVFLCRLNQRNTEHKFPPAHWDQFTPIPPSAAVSCSSWRLSAALILNILNKLCKLPVMAFHYVKHYNRHYFPIQSVIQIDFWPHLLMLSLLNLIACWKSGFQTEQEMKNVTFPAQFF